MNIATPKFGVGASALRKEDMPLVTGRGRYTDDVHPEGTLSAYVVRSPYSAARFTITSTEAAKAADGVHLVLTAADIPHIGPMKCQGVATQPDGSKHAVREMPVLCESAVRLVGDAVAFVVADTQALARDASELIEIEWEMGEGIAETAGALAEDAPLVWPELGTNRAYTYKIGDERATEQAFADAAHVSRIAFTNQRLISNYMETRASLGEYDAERDRFTLTTGTQGVHGVRDTLAKDNFSIDAEKVRVVTNDVGGGFGTKAFNYRENPLVLEAAKRLGRPVKWVGDRTEHFLVDAHGRDNVVVAEMAMDAEGRFLGLKIDLKANLGAYCGQFGPMIPVIGTSMTTGLYDIANIDVTVTGVYTNTTPVDAYRGAGRPEAAFLIERLADTCARDLGLPVEEIRRKNFIRPDQFPYKTATGRTYDVGEFDGHMTRAMECADWAGFEERAEEAKGRGRLRGIGMATYIEACAFAGSEAANLELNEDGTVTLYIGTQTNGQGHSTAYSQFIADKIGIDFDRIIVHQGDTDRLAKGGGTGGSRSIPLGGVSVAKASDSLAEKMRKVAADELEASAADIELVDGEARIVGTDRTMTYADLAKAASMEDRKADAEIVQDEATYPNGTHICEIEIDPETGTSEIVAYTIVDDFGVTVNPTLLLGQVHGGAVQGIGQALSEEAVHAEDGQLVTASFQDYTMPRAEGLPNFTFETRNVPSTTNALGIKGAGEAATIGSTPATLNAVVDALYRARGLTDIAMPATPQRIWNALNAV
ncbi:xanthine dehydrogenase family protein molybdopterin-binding subunit [Pararhizobium mangrovi]|uniref:Xanthine dehydrogenase family protein molybdopterin-binding subunit n=1 Tax=Pararhizobium mangrovi TaxID=2590452 RepID=A0A506U7L9_9HYPH|nr:xanthine dehydrogenase family protein molybdopterin-binding subunit [Pararhizobium mangrovi]TPW29860.1 xanthine dehydrogenase family protein molybdopterin-binding subunit [Pararhizobium mangrovi]